MATLQEPFDEVNVNDEELAELIRSGNEQAMAVLISRMMFTVEQRAAFYSSGKDSSDFEDLVQEGLTGLLAAIHSFRPDGGASFRTYASVCINNKILSAVKSACRQKNFPLSDYVSLQDRQELPVERGQGPEEKLIARENEERIYRLINTTLSEFEQKVLRLFLSGHSYSEIGALTNSSAKAADNALQRVRRKLRTAVAVSDN